MRRRKRMRQLKDLMTSNTQLWSTPKDFYKKLDDEFHFTLDPCPPNPTFDGLAITWNGSVFCNPPHAHTRKWLLKGLEEIKLNNADFVVYLIPVRPETKYFQELVFGQADEIRFVRGKLRFEDQRHKEGDVYNHAGAPFPVCVVVYWNNNYKGVTFYYTNNWLMMQSSDWLSLKRISQL
jgi:hypothetical protein